MKNPPVMKISSSSWCQRKEEEFFGVYPRFETVPLPVPCIYQDVNGTICTVEFAVLRDTDNEFIINHCSWHLFRLTSVTDGVQKFGKSIFIWKTKELLCRSRVVAFCMMPNRQPKFFFFFNFMRLTSKKIHIRWVKSPNSCIRCLQ